MSKISLVGNFIFIERESEQIKLDFLKVGLLEDDILYDRYYLEVSNSEKLGIRLIMKNYGKCRWCNNVYQKKEETMLCESCFIMYSPENSVEALSKEIVKCVDNAISISYITDMVTSYLGIERGKVKPICIPCGNFFEPGEKFPISTAQIYRFERTPDYRLEKVSVSQYCMQSGNIFCSKRCSEMHLSIKRLDIIKELVFKSRSSDDYYFSLYDGRNSIDYISEENLKTVKTVKTGMDNDEIIKKYNEEMRTAVNKKRQNCILSDDCCFLLCKKCLRSGFDYVGSIKIENEDSTKTFRISYICPTCKQSLIIFSDHDRLAFKGIFSESKNPPVLCQLGRFFLYNGR